MGRRRVKIAETPWVTLWESCDVENWGQANVLIFKKGRKMKRNMYLRKNTVIKI